MSALVRVLSDLIEKYYTDHSKQGRHYRLLVPGLTLVIAREIHDTLLSKSINSFLIVENSDEVNETRQCISATGLTSKRIGSFIAVVSPGQLVHVHDSIRGSGGTIRSISYSEEWPWIDTRTENFNFANVVLPEIVKQWSEKEEDQRWLIELILFGLIPTTRSESQRTELLLEHSIGTFKPDLYSDIFDIKKKFLCHFGIPNYPCDVNRVQELIHTVSIVSQKIRDKCKVEPNIRDLIKERVPDVIPHEKREVAMRATESILDGIGKPNNVESGLLAFYSSWSFDDYGTKLWESVTLEDLKRIFDVVPQSSVQLTHYIKGESLLCSKDKKKCVTFVGDHVEVTVLYDIKIEEELNQNWELKLFNRQKILDSKNIDQLQGTIKFHLNTNEFIQSHKNNIPLRIGLIRNANEEIASVRISMTLCGEHRPAIVVISPNFIIFDGIPTAQDSDDYIVESLETESPVDLYMFGKDVQSIVLLDDNDCLIPIASTHLADVVKTEYTVDPLEESSGRIIRKILFDTNYVVSICFEAVLDEEGEFTLEDEFRLVLSQNRSSRFDLLLDTFSGNTSDYYSHLGGICERVKRRIKIAEVMESSRGWKPIVGDLLSFCTNIDFSEHKYLVSLGTVDVESSFDSVEFPSGACTLIDNYDKTRNTLINLIANILDTPKRQTEHPIYASHPVYSHAFADEIEVCLVSYLQRYQEILNYLNDNQPLEWLQMFVLSHLDCVVHWSKSNNISSESVILMGPWHPLVISKRFMVQAALYERALLLKSVQRNQKTLFSLTSILGRIQGFNWIISTSPSVRKLEPAYIVASSDPGWHVGISLENRNFSLNQSVGNNHEFLDRVANGVGLAVRNREGAYDELAQTCISSYSRAFPSRRSIGIRLSQGYSHDRVCQVLDKYLHSESGPTSDRFKLSGGVRAYFSHAIENEVDIEWTADPPLRVFNYESDEECRLKEEPDILMVPPTHEVSFEKFSFDHGLPRGNGLNTIFSQPLTRLEEGRSQIPKSVTYEQDSECRNETGVGGSFLNTLVQSGQIAELQHARVESISLDHMLGAPWVILPGNEIDPAVLVQYVKNGIERDQQVRALWDYKKDILANSSSYFVLSTIPKSFSVAVNGFFGNTDIARELILELGNIGIAIGGEALKSGRHALGVIGLAGAVRLFKRMFYGSFGEQLDSQSSIGFLIPVDSFPIFGGQNSTGQSELDGKRSDLLAIQIQSPNEDNDNFRLVGCSIEAKFTSQTYSPDDACLAIQQAQSTTHQFKLLVELSLQKGAAPERLVLLELIRFGLRLASVENATNEEEWLRFESSVYRAILAGKYEYCEEVTNAVLVTTEKNLRGVPELRPMEQGLWIRLTKKHWPGVSDSSQLRRIEQQLTDAIVYIPQNSLDHGEEEGSDTQKESVPPTVANVDGASSVSGITSDLEQTDKRLSPILLGTGSNRKRLYFDPQAEKDPLDNMNMMITGSSGSGKTQLLKFLIHQIREQGKPVLVLDFKNDFASDEVFASNCKLQRTFVSFDGLPYNPLIPYPLRHPASKKLLVQNGQHIVGVAAVLASTYQLGAQQQIAVKNAIESAFSAKGIKTSGSVDYVKDAPYPDFSDIGLRIKSSSPLAYNRLDPLFTLDLFPDENRSNAFRSLISDSQILDFSQIPSEKIRNALAQLIIMSAHGYYTSKPPSGAITQFLIFDEAHRVLDSNYMVRLARECRAFGVSLVLSSQFPTDFPIDISASMATKVVHGNGSEHEKVRDIVQLIGCVGMEERVSRLERFQALINNGHHSKAQIRTMNYPLHLIWSKIIERGRATVDELSKTEGVHTSKLSIMNLVRQLELHGLVETKGENVEALRDES